MNEQVLVTGGTGKTGRYVVKYLQEQGLTPRIATRTPKGESDVKFDWRDHKCFKDAFQNIESVYLVAPTDSFNSMDVMEAGLKAALEANVKRFVLLSSSSLEEGDVMMGEVHAWLRKNALEWSILRPSWFMQNFSEGQHLAPIKQESTIYSATEDGQVGFISAQDIGRCAATLLTVPKSENTDYILTGPETISYDNVAEALSRRIGREVQHKRLSSEGISRRFLNIGLPEEYATMLAKMDEEISKGAENMISNNVESITGTPPISFDEFIQENMDVWDKC